VDWIAEHLANMNNATVPPADQPFGKHMQELLRDFQSKQNLKADGVAGPRTWMRLNQMSGVEEPRLLSLNRTEK
jgi:general secretion pathway protein A